MIFKSEHLNSLPNEIILEIFQYLPIKDRIENLLKVDSNFDFFLS